MTEEERKEEGGGGGGEDEEVGDYGTTELKIGGNV
jgi:hypothetical protein